MLKNEKMVVQMVHCKAAADAIISAGWSVKTAERQTALFMYSFMTERQSGVLRKIRGEMKGGFCLKKRIPFFLSDFFFGRIDEAGFDILPLFPELPGIDDFLSDNVGTCSDSGNRAHVYMRHPDGQENNGCSRLKYRTMNGSIERQ